MCVALVLKTGDTWATLVVVLQINKLEKYSFRSGSGLTNSVPPNSDDDCGSA